MRVTHRSVVNPRFRKSMKQAFVLRDREMRAIGRAIDMEFTKNERKLFATEGASGGAKWPPLTAAYRKARRRAGFKSRKIMVRTGELKRSLTSRTDSKHHLRITTAPRATISVGTDVRHAAYHIKGNPLSNPRLPQRDTLQATDRQYTKYDGIIYDYLVRVKSPRTQKILAEWHQRRRGVA